MPVYEYGCTRCDNRFEVMQRFSDPPVETCTSCGGSVKKLISQTAFVLKGSGWYATDYGRTGSGPKEGEKDSSKEGGKEPSKTGDAPKSESKAETAGANAGTPTPSGNSPTAEA